jgi:hypothetical protein
MRRMLSLIVGLAVVIAFSLATPADAQRSKRSQTTNAGVAKQQQEQQAPNDARSSYGRATSGSSNATNQQSGQCYIPTDVNNLGYWGECSTKGAHQVK